MLLTFIADYRIPPNMSLRHCKMGEWHLLRRMGKVVSPILAFVKGGMRILMGPAMKSYLRHFRLAPTQCAANMFRILGCVDAVRLNLINHFIGFIPCQICLYFSI